ncbi:endopeptidase La [Legionella longbeachae]|uniref:Lon protease n=1 Tax=Legionella longbeachae serogroup 1 (strain NSW150) TaxID=661367 RepID=D3HRW5_LEGLN|nr:endopeptidase La [Legionella longbeachae]VEE02148.1 ATP-dependent protease La [Legionella oakridgensis]HBD7396607.1 endopeptidase La [Legionella pneumophila]ARB91552.1 endopeptidase La [Legionella longbeachae]ARM35302.1 endopeptidase La [Legionella longbeachae]EEZ95228.1 ATP-dependent protease La [Legionella longbeachae D-4968]
MSIENKESSNETEKMSNIPVLPLRDVVVYPHMVIPLFVGRGKSIKALEAAMVDNKHIFLVAQKKSSNDDPSEGDIFQVGTLSSVLQLLKLPDGTVKVLVEGEKRAKAKEYHQTEGYLEAALEVMEDENAAIQEPDIGILMRSLMSQFEQYIKLNKKIPPEVLSPLAGIEEPGRLADTIAAHLTLKIDDKQDLLETLDVGTRLERLMSAIENEIDLLHVEKRVRGRVKRQMEKSQREYYLNEQMKAIQKELGELGEEGNEIEQLEKSINKAGMPKEAKEKSLAELHKLKMMSPMSAEATVIRNYLDWMLEVPWKKRTKIQFDLLKAEKLLDKEHYGLEQVKKRIIEYLAVQQRVKRLKGPILCLVGPPGVGKTSLGQSIANATGRTFIRIALGGVRDEAEIRGHRRTYIGSMPGKIIQKLCKAGVKNPLIMLDEVDKMAMDFRGDPAAALLEVLDPEQNHTFNDHYLEVDYDLSDVMFIATANSLEIPAPLLDRMEVIRLAGYTEDEKVSIAERYLVPKQIVLNGLNNDEIHISEGAIREIIRHYTREAGVRNLERDIASVCRKVVKEILSNKKIKKMAVSLNNIEKYLGVKKYRYGLAEQFDQVGQVTGLAWTSVGGELLTIEASMMPGKGKVTHTGQLGEVMQESIHAAMTVVRSRAKKLGLLDDFYDKNDFHVHVPEGATPKDGPSAGIGMCTVLVSVVTQIPVKADVAMTGEITLRGQVLPIGGLKEKLLAAHRGGIKHVIIPEENVKDLEEIPDNVLRKLTIHPVQTIEQVLELALQRSPWLNETTNAQSGKIVGKRSKKIKNNDLHAH